MIDKQKNRYVFQCDECNEPCETGKRDFHEALDVIRSEGWRTVKAADNTWEHYCANC